MKKVPERFKWASEVMASQPGETILEIGCGTGILAELLATQLPGGKITVIDKSAAMIKNLYTNNKALIDDGRITVIQNDFKSYDWKTAMFDKVVAFNVNFFLKNQHNELAILKRLLNASGKLYVFYKPPYTVNLSFATPIKKLLTAAGFTIEKTMIEFFDDGNTVGIVATPV